MARRFQLSSGCWLVSLWLLVAWIPTTRGQTDANLLLGDDFSLLLGGGTRLTVEEAQAACELQLDILLVCVQAECANFADLCPASNVNSTNLELVAQEDFTCASIADIICTTYSVNDCCMAGCATELQTLAICVGESTTANGSDGQGLSCGVPSCNTYINPLANAENSENATEATTTTSATNSTNAPTATGEETTATTTFAPTILSTTQAPTLAPSLLATTLAPTVQGTAPSSAAIANTTSPTSAAQPSLSPTGKSTEVPDAIQVPSVAPLDAETTAMPTQMPTILDTNVTNNSSTMSPTVEDDSETPAEEDETPSDDASDWFRMHPNLVAISGAFAATCFLIIVLVCNKTGETGRSMARHEPHPLGRQAQSRGARSVV